MPSTPPQNRFLAPNGLAAMHGDATSSDSTPQRGPGVNQQYALKYYSSDPIQVYATILGGDPLSDTDHTGGLWGVGMDLYENREFKVPFVHLLDKYDPENPLASLTLPTTDNALGAAYTFLASSEYSPLLGQTTPAQYVVLVDANRVLHFYYWTRDQNGEFAIVDSVYRSREGIPLDNYIPVGDTVVGIVPDWQGRVWFATKGSKAGYFDLSDGTGAAIWLDKCNNEQVPEGVWNTISSCPVGVVIASTHGIYMLRAAASTTRAAESGTIEYVWDPVAYDRGYARKPGQLSRGTGVSPTLFGPDTGYDYLTIADNYYASPSQPGPARILVLNTATGEALVPPTPAFASRGKSAIENSVIGYGKRIWVSDTYGYEYPSQLDLPPSVPPEAPFVGGLQCFELQPADPGSEFPMKLEQVAVGLDIPSCAVPRLAVEQNIIYTLTVKDEVRDKYFFAVVSADDLTLIQQVDAFAGSILNDPLQMVGTIHEGVVFQGTKSGILKVGTDLKDYCDPGCRNGDNIEPYYYKALRWQSMPGGNGVLTLETLEFAFSNADRSFEVKFVLDPPVPAGDNAIRGCRILFKQTNEIWKSGRIQNNIWIDTRGTYAADLGDREITYEATGPNLATNDQEEVRVVITQYPAKVRNHRGVDIKVSVDGGSWYDYQFYAPS